MRRLAHAVRPAQHSLPRSRQASNPAPRQVSVPSFATSTNVRATTRTGPTPAFVAPRPAAAGGSPATKSLGPSARAATTRPPATPAVGAEHVRAVVAQPGAPLPASLRGQMEAGFGRDLGHVRVHDDPTAARAATALEARAFSLGPHLVFGDGQYAPGTPAGRGLIAHELAHVMQAYGVMAQPAATVNDPAAETEADRAVRVLAAGGRPMLATRTGPSVIRRAALSAAAPASLPASAPGPATVSKEAAAQPATAAPPALRLPPGMTVAVDEPAGLGTTRLVVVLTDFTFPADKGAGNWVQKAYADAAANEQLICTPIINGDSVSFDKDEDTGYRAAWLKNFGFTTTKSLSDTIMAKAKEDENVRDKLADPEVHNLVTGLGDGFGKSGCDVDHIVERQLNGTSHPTNLQLLTSSKNRAAGPKLYHALLSYVRQIRDPSMRGPGVRDLRIRIAAVTVPVGQADASFVIEDLLRSSEAVRGSSAPKGKGVGTPVRLSAGGQSATVYVRDSNGTSLDNLSRRIVPGMRLRKYHRGPGGAQSTKDTVSAVLDSHTMQAAQTDDATILLDAELVSANSPQAAAPPSPPTAADPAPDKTAPGEARRLKLNPATNKKIAFHYLYLSPGELTKVTLDDQGRFRGEGTIRSSVPFLGKLTVVYANDELKLVAPIPADKLVSPLPSAFRFTGGELALQLSPSLVPNGKLTFAVGPPAKPVLLGTLTVALQNGALVATGELVPAGKLPGVSAAAGQVMWNSDTGWSGKITASTASIPHSTADVEVGFTSTGGKFAPYAHGAITTTVRNSRLVLGARWDGKAVTYTGSVTIDKPLPLINSVKLSGSYSDRSLRLQGDADIKWNTIKGTMQVEYNRTEEDEEGHFSGAATVTVKTAKADGSLALKFDEKGYSGKGSIGYQITKDLKPVLTAEIKDRKVKLSGEVTVGDIVLVRRWPSAQGGTVPLLKGVGAKFSVPTPVPAVTAYIELRGSLQLGYGVGPVMLRGIVFKGELYPLEDDPQVTAKLTGTFAVPAYAELSGTFGAYIGAEIALGAAGAKGGIDITPSLRIDGEGGIAIAADYNKDGFAFGATAYAEGQLTAAARVNLAADLYAAWGLFSHRWTYDVANVSAPLGPQLKLTLGRVAYDKNGQLTWPSLSQIKVEPESIDPVRVVKDMLGRGQAKER
nr:DUF4157 domain-containing protein [Streptomyces antibioticus]